MSGASFLSCAVSFLTSALSGMGVGGGGIFTVFLINFLSAEQICAQGINLFLFSITAFSSCVTNTFFRKINYFVAAVIAVSGIAGCLIGTNLALVLPRELIRRIFGGILIMGGIKALFCKNKK